MKTTVVYPDNSVEVDGNPVEWSPADFEKQGIALVRVKEIPVQGGHAEHRHDADHYLMVFPTREIAVFEVRSNADGRHPPRKLRTKPALRVKRGVAVRREHEIRNGELFLRCQGSTSCHQMLPAEDFYKTKNTSFGRMYLCKKDWNAYLKVRNQKLTSKEQP